MPSFLPSSGLHVIVNSLTPVSGSVNHASEMRTKIMFLIAGLGNPGKKYEATRHNVGFDVIDRLAEKYNIDVREYKFKALVGKGVIEGHPVILAKPQTFMNLSGESISEIVRFYKLDPEEEMVVISDDVTLDAGVTRIRRKGSAGGHNGLKSIIACCGTQDFMRIRVGVGKLGVHEDMVAHVLGRMNAEDRRLAELSYDRAAVAAVLILDGKLDQAMNLYNGKVEEAQ